MALILLFSETKGIIAEKLEIYLRTNRCALPIAGQEPEVQNILPGFDYWQHANTQRIDHTTIFTNNRVSNTIRNIARDH